MQTSFSLFFFKKKDKNVEMERFIIVNIVYIKHGQKPRGTKFIQRYYTSKLCKSKKTL